MARAASVAAAALLAATLAGCSADGKGPSPGPAPKPPGPTAKPYTCESEFKIGGVVMPGHKGLALDDDTFRGCPGKIPVEWPHTSEPVASLRMFKAWAPDWPEEARQPAWDAIAQFTQRSGAKVLVGTHITCNETEDDTDWALVLRLLKQLGPNSVMGVAIGNEMEQLYTKANITKQCITNIWAGGYFWRKTVERVQDLEKLGDGFGNVTLTSVFGGAVLGGGPFVETPQAMALSYLRNATKEYGSRWAYSINVYPYYDPGNHWDNHSHTCNAAITRGLDFSPEGDMPSTLVLFRQKLQELTGNTNDTMWLTETGWSSPRADTLAGANLQMAQCANFSTEKVLQRYYDGVLNWNMTLGEIQGPDHIFYFTIRDSNNFGVGEHFGLIHTCDNATCKMQQDYLPNTTTTTTTTTAAAGGNTTTTAAAGGNTTTTAAAGDNTTTTAAAGGNTSTTAAARGNTTTTRTTTTTAGSTTVATSSGRPAQSTSIASAVELFAEVVI